MWKLKLLSITLLLVVGGCLADDKVLRVGSGMSNCNSTIIYDVYKDWDYHLIWDGDNFQSPCNFVFRITNTSIPYDGEQRYSICVERDMFDKHDSSTWLTCKMYSPPFGSSEVTEKYECYQRGDKGKKADVCADINEFMNVSFTTLYGLNSQTPAAFKNSVIKIKVYSKWNMPLPIILAIVFGSLGFCAIVTIVIIAICVTVVNKHHRSRQQAQRLRMAQYNPGTAVQYQPNQPLQLQAQNNYATDYGQGQSAFQYGVQNSAFQNGDQDLKKEKL